jgi:uncharacterized protein YcfL
MKKIMMLFSVALVTACGSPAPEDIDPTIEVTSETSEKIKQAQDENVELEEIDGELDSIIKTLN